ncbi:hypothetical protein EYF80_043155 [Liparis tanakae]|uniref:Uncharacterized protein n=1 Tax=Liparis tanakae TaxID=230148 RepID=A0A4Z2G263_9TELE|nr:hypothetical protein EYF80_043155 [Liparis tanakae]
MRNVPSSLNWTGGISDCRNLNTTSATPADSILDLFTTGEETRIKQLLCGRTTSLQPINGLSTAESSSWMMMVSVQLSSRCEVRLTVASKVGDGQSAGELKLVVMGWNPGQDPLEDAALPPLKQLLHGLI